MERSRLAWLGWVLSGIVGLVLLGDAATDFLVPQKVAGAMQETGWPLGSAPLLGSICLVAGLLYLLPRTAVVGAILVTGFFGGAVATHVRVGPPIGPEIVFGVVVIALAWGGLWLRDARVRAILPLR